MKQKTNDLFNVLVYGKNLGVKRLIKSVCAQRNIPLIDTKNKTDLIAYDYKIAFIVVFETSSYCFIIFLKL
jgi:hypothetical protein